MTRNEDRVGSRVIFKDGEDLGAESISRLRVKDDTRDDAKR